MRKWFQDHNKDENEIDNLIKGADYNNDGKINYEEFVNLVVQRKI